jgi:hypothetical protein
MKKAKNTLALIFFLGIIFLWFYFVSLPDTIKQGFDIVKDLVLECIGFLLIYPIYWKIVSGHVSDSEKIEKKVHHLAKFTPLVFILISMLIQIHQMHKTESAAKSLENSRSAKRLSGENEDSK